MNSATPFVSEEPVVLTVPVEALPALAGERRRRSSRHMLPYDGRRWHAYWRAMLFGEEKPEEFWHPCWTQSDRSSEEYDKFWAWLQRKHDVQPKIARAGVRATRSFTVDGHNITLETGPFWHLRCPAFLFSYRASNRAVWCAGVFAEHGAGYTKSPHDALMAVGAAWVHNLEHWFLFYPKTGITYAIWRTREAEDVLMNVLTRHVRALLAKNTPPPFTLKPDERFALLAAFAV